MAVEEFQDRDDAYLKWVEGSPTGYVINVHRGRRGEAKLHSAACNWIRSRPPFTTSYIKVCSTALYDLAQWAVDHPHAVLSHCGTCQPPPPVASSHVAPRVKSTPPAPAASREKASYDWEIDGPHNGQQRVRLWADRYIPFQDLTDDQRAAREALRGGLLQLVAGSDEILCASYAGTRPSRMDIENLVLYNIDATAGGCFKSGTTHGVRFEMAHAAHGAAPSGRSYPCLYEYGLTSPESCFSHWRLGRHLASFAGADLGRFASVKRLEQVWFAIHHAQRKVAEQSMTSTGRFAIRLTLTCPSAQTTVASPELVKVLFDGTVAAFQSHNDLGSVDEVAARLARITGRRGDLIKELLLERGHAGLGADRLVHLRGLGLQWNPADHLLMAAQVVCRPAPGPTWTLAGEIHAVEPAF